MCIKSMEWMKSLDPAKVAVVNIAIESKREEVEKLVASLAAAGTVVIATDAVRKAFSGPPAVPTLVLRRARQHRQGLLRRARHAARRGHAGVGRLANPKSCIALRCRQPAGIFPGAGVIPSEARDLLRPLLTASAATTRAMWRDCG